ncbi:TPA: glycosyltransferase family 2 protein [Klebsiella oxytoca]|nr:glycosyltransferase family 2 protein [Klebsiella oxytoca]
MPYFSVVIPTYNASKNIRKTLNSVIEQSFKDYEIIIVDDASSDLDELILILNDYKNTGCDIKLYSFDKNKNGAAARNKGINESTGQYIAFLDSDDTWELNKLEFFYSYIKERNNPLEIYYSRINLYIDGVLRDGLHPIECKKNKDSMAKYLFGLGGIIQTSSIVVSRKIALEIQFNESYKRHQDYDFCIRASFSGFPFKMVETALTNYFASRKTHKSKESANYSKYWIEDMKKYLRDNDDAYFKTFVLPYKHLDDGNFIKAILCFISNFHHCDVGVIFSNIMNKFKTRLKRK